MGKRTNEGARTDIGRLWRLGEGVNNVYLDLYLVEKRISGCRTASQGWCLPYPRCSSSVPRKIHTYQLNGASDWLGSAATNDRTDWDDHVSIGSYSVVFE